MPMPKPRKGESQSDYMSRCMSEMKSPDRTNEQNVAACLQGWRDSHGGKKPSKSIEEMIASWKKLFADPERLQRIIKAASDDAPEPEEGESHQDFIDRCTGDLTEGDGGMDDDDAEDACQLAWDDYQEDEGKSAGKIVHKQHATEGKGVEFILSDATPDRFGDIVQVESWEFANFKKNPVALFNHNPNAPVGVWNNVRVGDKALRGDLILAPKGISPRIDEIRGLVEAGILRAVSVGFKPLASHPVDTSKNDPMGFGPKVFTKCELVECSLVSIPANPNALAVAKSLKVSAA